MLNLVLQDITKNLMELVTHVELHVENVRQLILVHNVKMEELQLVVNVPVQVLKFLSQKLLVEQLLHLKLLLTVLTQELIQKISLL